MRQSTTNPAVVNQIDANIRNGQKNIDYLEKLLQKHQSKSLSQQMGSLNLNQEQQSDGQYSQLSGGNSAMPPNPPFAKGPPGSGVPAKRPNYSRLDLIKFDTEHIGPKIQMMMAQLQFKLDVEKQYKEGIDKMAKLYQMEGDRRSRQDAEQKGNESSQKLQLLRQALKRYADIYIPSLNDEDENDGIF
jgi:hypothetical protein